MILALKAAAAVANPQAQQSKCSARSTTTCQVEPLPRKVSRTTPLLDEHGTLPVACVTGIFTNANMDCTQDAPLANFTTSARG